MPVTRLATDNNLGIHYTLNRGRHNGRQLPGGGMYKFRTNGICRLTAL